MQRDNSLETLDSGTKERLESALLEEYGTVDVQGLARSLVFECAIQEVAEAMFDLATIENRAESDDEDEDLRQIPANRRRAAYWFRKAAELTDDPVAWYYYGNISSLLPDSSVEEVENGINALIKAAQQGYSRAYYMLGNYYWDGDVLPLNRVRAIDFYEDAAKLGEADAMALLAMYYETGEVVERDLDRALYWNMRCVQAEESARDFQVTDKQRKAAEFYERLHPEFADGN